MRIGLNLYVRRSSFLYYAAVADDCVVLVAERRRKGLDIYARPGHDPRRS